MLPRDSPFNSRCLQWGEGAKDRGNEGNGSYWWCQSWRGREGRLALWSPLRLLDNEFPRLLLQKELGVRFSATRSLRNRLSSGRAKGGDLLRYPEEKRQVILCPELSPGWTPRFNSGVMSNDDVLLVLGISNAPAGDSCPRNTIYLSAGAD